MGLWLKEGREKSRHKQAKAPYDIHALEMALRFRMNPATVRKYDHEIVAVAGLVDRDPAEVATWAGRDRRQLLMLAQAQVWATKPYSEEQPEKR